MESRTRGLRPRTQKNSEAKAKDTGARVLKKKFSKFFSGEKGLQKFFSGDLHLRKTKKGLHKFSARFLAFSNNISTAQNIVLSLSQGQGNFWGLEASRPRTSRCVLEDSTSVSNPISYLARFFGRKFRLHTPLIRLRYCSNTGTVAIQVTSLWVTQILFFMFF